MSDASCTLAGSTRPSVRRQRSGRTTTTIRLMRPDDLIFGAAEGD
jgi:hypothetical protein